MCDDINLVALGKICLFHRDRLWKVGTDATIRAARKLEVSRDERFFQRGNSYNDELKTNDTCVLAAEMLLKRLNYLGGHVSLKIRTVTTILTRNYRVRCEDFKVS